MRVVEVSSFVASPLAGMTLAQLGADVIRVDPIGGAGDRNRWPVTDKGVSLYWKGLNKGKRSITVDMRSPEGQRLIQRLITESGPRGGIVLSNVVGRSWLEPDELERLRPDLIHLQITGRPDGGTAVDYTVNASMGIPLLTGPVDHNGPVNNMLPAWDIACGLYAALGIVTADQARATTGRGQRITLALHDVALTMVGHLGMLAEAELLAQPRERIGNHVFGQFSRDFRCRDGEHVMVVVLTKRHWRDLTEVAGIRAAVEALQTSLGANFDDEGERYRHRDTLAALLVPWFATRELAEVSATLERTSVMWSAYRTVKQAVADNRDNPVLSVIDQPEVGPYLAAGSALRLQGLEQQIKPAPSLGGDSADVLGSWLGLAGDEIDGLRQRQVIG